MSIKKAQVLIGNNQKNQYREFCELAISQNNKDLYFYDKSFPNFHISLHNDGSIWMTSNDKNIKSVNLFSKSKFKNNFTIMPFIFYFSSNFYKYPQASKDIKNRRLKWFVNDEKYLENFYLIKFFLEDEGFHVKKVRKIDKNLPSSFEMKGIKNDGKEDNKNIEQVVISFAHNKIYFDLMTIAKDQRDLGDIRILLICRPDGSLNLTQYIKEKYFAKINIEDLSPNSVSLSKFNIDGHEVYQIAY